MTKRASRLDPSELAFLRQAVMGASHAGFRPNYVNRLVVAGLIRADGSSSEPVFPGSRGHKMYQHYKITEAGRAALGQAMETVNG